MQLSCRSSPLPTLRSIFPSTSLPCTDTRATSVFHGHNYSCTRRGCCAFLLPTSRDFIFLCFTSADMRISFCLNNAALRRHKSLIGLQRAQILFLHTARLLFYPSVVISQFHFRERIALDAKALLKTKALRMRRR